MLDLAIVGAGLCGLSLARQLPATLKLAVFDARDRPGGRVLTTSCAATGLAVDLGPTWFWPDTEPRIAALLAELGLAHFAQHDSGTVLRLSDPNRAADPLPPAGVHGGAQRIEGGTTRLVQALVDALPAGTLRLGHVLAAVIEREEHVELRFQLAGSAGSPLTLAARRVVLAMPPRVLAERVRFVPALPANALGVLHATPTWMGAQAKAVLTYPRAFWRDQGLSGNAFVGHPQAVLGEVFDASDASGAPGALGGFFCLRPAMRASMRVGMPLLVASQLTQLFGAQADDGHMHLHDWAGDAWACSTRDRDEPAGQPLHADAWLRQPLWNRRLHLGGTETASYGTGHMEGALESAAHLARSLLSTAPRHDRSAIDNAGALHGFAAWVDTQRSQAVERYRQLLNRSLATQQREQLTQHAVLGAAEQLYAEGLSRLAAIDWDMTGVGSTQGRSDLTPAVLAPFSGFSQALLDAAIGFNRGSCAISNFPDEHDPAPDYVAAIGRDLAAAWREFALNANDLLLARTRSAALQATASV